MHVVSEHFFVAVFLPKHLRHLGKELVESGKLTSIAMHEVNKKRNQQKRGSVRLRDSARSRESGTMDPPQITLWWR